MGGRPGTIGSENEQWATLPAKEFYELDLTELARLADKVGVNLQGIQSTEQARTRLLNDAIHV